MTDITEADHDAVDWLYEMGVIAPHHLRLANEAFARHREQTERQTADLIETQAREIERLRGVLKRWQCSGCPDCSGDCGSANPPVMCCIMEETRAALAGDSHDQ